MELWRYIAVESHAGSNGPAKRGELMASSASEVRASLRRIGWQVVDLRRARRPWALPRQLRQLWHRHLRRRRQAQRGEVYEGLASLLESGLPLVECLEVLSMERVRWRDRPRQTMLIQWRESLRSGSSPAHAMKAMDSWFDEMDCAMIESGQHGGMLPSVLEQMAARGARFDRLGHQVISALTYPAIVTVAALAVALFLSVKTLPDLAGLLVSADIEVPALTRAVMAVGQIAAHWGWLLLLGGIAVAASIIVLWRLSIQRSRRFAAIAAARTPRLFRAWAVARFAQGLADLLRAGVPALEAMRILAATLPTAFAHVVRDMATDIEQGQTLAQALSEGHWFTPQFRRLVHSAEVAGDLEGTLERISQRDERQVERQLARLATLLEPTAVLLLAALVGIVVLAAILPLTRLQEIIG